MIGGLFVGIGGLIDPRILGIGYDVVRDLLNGQIVGTVLITLVVVKALEVGLDGNRTVLEAGSRNLVVAYPDESLGTAVARMLKNDIRRLVVVSRNDPHYLLGYIARSGVLAARQGAPGARQRDAGRRERRARPLFRGGHIRIPGFREIPLPALAEVLPRRLGIGGLSARR